MLLEGGWTATAFRCASHEHHASTPSAARTSLEENRQRRDGSFESAEMVLELVQGENRAGLAEGFEGEGGLVRCAGRSPFATPAGSPMAVEAGRGSG